MTFKDHFSRQASHYARYRPHYPEALFHFLASLVRNNERAWDCACGSGQAACGLSPYFREILATDASKEQLSFSTPRKNIRYSVSSCEQTGIASNSIDLIVVAQALHWLDFEKFFGEARRVLKPQGVIAAWCYNLLSVSPEIDPVLKEFYRQTVGPFWPPERKLIESGYRTIPFPFERITTPLFAMEAEWNLEELLGYLETWSAVQKYKEAKKSDPVKDITSALENAWGSPCRKTVRWPLHILAGRNNG